MKKHNVDKIFLSILAILVLIGIIMFTSASFGILARNETKFYGVLIGQFFFGILGGLLLMYICFRIPYKFWRTYSLIIFIFSIILTLLVFVPHIGVAHKGAARWLNIFGFSFQPVEVLKIGFIIYFAAWLSWARGRVRDPKFGILPLVVLLGLIALILGKQPDTKSIILITITAVTMFFASGAPIKYILSIICIAVVCFGILVLFKPYLMQRVKTFIDPSRDSGGASYQLQQSLIAIGSGGVMGRGLGQSIQKFNYLPEPQGDSIFAVVGEELGFLGSIVIIFLYIAFALRGYRIALYSPDAFSKLLVLGLITMITAQSFMNIASIVGVFPLTGVPLVFISQGGTALLTSLGVMGLILQISKYKTMPVLEKS